MPRVMPVLEEDAELEDILDVYLGAKSVHRVSDSRGDNYVVEFGRTLPGGPNGH